jgi:hypothetical protein
MGHRIHCFASVLTMAFKESNFTQAPHVLIPSIDVDRRFVEVEDRCAVASPDQGALRQPEKTIKWAGSSLPHDSYHDSWGVHEEIVKQLYYIEDFSLWETKEIMESDYNFRRRCTSYLLSESRRNETDLI